jgi:hypothetical protein
VVPTEVSGATWALLLHITLFRFLFFELHSWRVTIPARPRQFAAPFKSMLESYTRTHPITHADLESERPWREKEWLHRARSPRSFCVQRPVGVLVEVAPHTVCGLFDFRVKDTASL